MQSLLGYKPEDLMNKSLYEYHHGADSESLMGSFKCGKSLAYTIFIIFKPKICPKNINHKLILTNTNIYV